MSWMRKIQMKAVLGVFLAWPALSVPSVDYGDISLYPQGVDDSGAHWFALDVVLDPGWKTYWRHAGQNGIDPKISVIQSGKLLDAEIFWPEPEFYDNDGILMLGYKDDFSVLIRVDSLGPDSDPKIPLEVSFKGGVCETLCAPVEKTFEALPVFRSLNLPDPPKPFVAAPLCEKHAFEPGFVLLVDAEDYGLILDQPEARTGEGPYRAYQKREGVLTPLACQE